MSSLSFTPLGVVIARRKYQSTLFKIWVANEILDSLAPKYDELAELYAKNKETSSKVTIAKIDATANDVPDSITGFPTIKLFPAGSKDTPVEYSGSRTVEDLANFVKENGKHGVDAFAAQAEAENNQGTDGEAEPSEKPEHDELWIWPFC